MKKIIVIADWAADDLSRQEFKSSVEGFAKNPKSVSLNFISSTPSTIHTAFLLSQVVETEERYSSPLETVIFQNTDPRLQSNQAVSQAQGAKFIIIRLKSGMHICGPNAGYDFALIKSKIDEVFLYPDLDKGSQFRSRDLFSRVCSHLADEMEDELELEETSSNIIPELTGFFIGHVDNYGNIKTTSKLSDLKGKFELGDMIKISINNISRSAKFVQNLFGEKPGVLVIYPGSSGHKNNPYLEISAWSYFTEKTLKTGSSFFNYPRPGQEILLQK